ncbi:MAG: histidinol-phosphate transaminase, partial [Gammaproteobacteria bacterium]
VRPAVQEMSAYHVADASGMIKLDAMENPYPLPADLKQDWLALLAQVEINRYPDPAANELKVELRRAFALPDTSGLMLGNGSDELIQILVQALGGHERTILAPEPSFVMYRLIAAMNGMRYVGVNLQDKNFALDLPSLLRAIDKHQPALVFIANPNNPTGNIHSLHQLRELADHCPGLLIIDEAYAPFTDITALSLVDEFAHVMVMRTVSKMGLAGLRLGYMIGNTQWIEQLEKVRLPYNINALTQVSAKFALKHKSVLDEQARQICRDREMLLQSLSDFTGVTAFSSQANFILFRVIEGSGVSVFETLKSEGVLIKNLHGTHPALSNCLRVTVGTPEENQAFTKALQHALSQS